MKKRILFLFCLVLPILQITCTGKNMVNDDSLSEKLHNGPYFQIIYNPDLPGCGNCHNNPEEREYSFAAKANEKWADHRFDIYASMMSINDCLLCHSVEGSGSEGSVAPRPLRSIVHQAHMSSENFKGNCFTCHYIMGDSSPHIYNYSD